MQTNRKGRLGRTILGYSAFSFGTSLFLFSFLYLTAFSFAEIYFDKHQIVIDEFARSNLKNWIRMLSIFASMGFFVALFLVLLSQKLSYLREIIRGVDALRIHRMDYKVRVEGEDELTELAERINYLSETERKLVEREREMSDERRLLIRSLSHDIRTPLTSMLSYTEFLQQKSNLTMEEMREYLDMMQKKELQMKELTDRLLEGTQRKVEFFENGKLLMEQLVEEWEGELEDFDCEIILDCPSFSGNFDLQELRRIFDNLSSNIKKYADPTQRVTLKILVEENKLFIEQKNAKKQKNEEIESHGIGLISIRQIIRAYNGETQIIEDEDTFSIQMMLVIS